MGATAAVSYTLGELDDLAGHIAFQANHTDNGKVRKEWRGIFGKIDAILTGFTDEPDDAH